MNEHPSRLTLERFSVDDLPPAAREGTERHVASCAACRRDVEDLSAMRMDLVSRLPPEAFVGRVAERRDRGDKMEGRRRLGFLAVAAAALAAAALLVLVARPRDEIRLKGAGAIVHRNRGGQVKVMSDADTIRAGDALRIVVTLPRSDRVEVWFVDAHGRIDRLLPEGAVDLGAGERALPGSAVVEAPCVDLWMVVATGSEVGPATESALQRAVAGGVHPGGAWSPAGSKVQALRCE